MRLFNKLMGKEAFGWLACMKRRMALVLVTVLLLETPGAVFSAGGAPGTGEAAAASVREGTFPEGEVSFVSFPSRFEGRISQGNDAHCYVFELDFASDVTIQVDFDRDITRYGAELLDSGGERLFISQRKKGQRIIAKGENRLSPGRYILRIFPVEGADTSEPFNVSMEKLKPSDSAVRDIDYSELHMTSSLLNEDSPWFLNGLDPDYAWSEGGLVKMATPSNVGRGVDSGGINNYATYYYHNWMGPVSENVMSMEEVAPPTDEIYSSYEAYEEYLKYLQDDAMGYKDGGEPLVHVQNSIFLPRAYNEQTEDWYFDPEAERTEGWQEQIKNAVMNYGAVSTTVNALVGLECKDKAHMFDNGWRMRTASASNLEVYNVYDVGESISINHNVAIVGWDDNYPREKFRYDEYPLASSSELGEEMTTADDFFLPEEDGAWIVQNSWGREMGDKGYYYVSYEDRTLGAGQEPTCYYASEASDNYNTLYTLSEGPALINIFGISAISSVFTAGGSEAEALRAVGFEIHSNMVSYQIAINRGDDIGQGLKAENICASGFNRYAGTYTVRLDNPILLEPGERFEVVVSARGDEEVHYPLVGNTLRQDNIDPVKGVAFLYENQGEPPKDLGGGIGMDGMELWGYFPIRAFCYDSSLGEGEIRRNVTVPADPSTHYLEIPMDGWETTASVASPSQLDSYGMEETLKKNRKRVRSNFGAALAADLEMTGIPELVGGELPEAFDLREAGVLTPVRNQGPTNTCWAFANTAALESSYLLSGGNLYNYNYSSGIRLDTGLPVLEDGRVLYRFDKQDESSLSLGTFTGKLLSWDDGPIEDADGKLLWQFSGDLSAVDFSAFAHESGETFETENGEPALIFEPRTDGILNVKVSLADDPTKTAACQIVLVEENKVNALSVSPETMTLKPGRSGQLTVTVDADEGAQVTPVFTSARPEIAAVDEKGKVLALRSGVTVITVRAGDKEAVCEVTVTERSGGGSSGRWNRSGFDGISSRFPGIVQGSWSFHTDGSWSFRAGNRLYQNEWAYLYNPYALNNRGNDGWFRFDENGKMITGWFMDWDGHWYYLNPASDGEMGRMMTGWVLIKETDGTEKWYYFNEEKGGPLGALTDRRREEEAVLKTHSAIIHK